jgi:hypothetical protein
MGPTAGSSGLALIIGISEGTLGGLVGVQAFFAAADHVAVWGARVKSMKLFGYPHFPSYRRTALPLGRAVYVARSAIYFKIYRPRYTGIY